MTNPQFPDHFGMREVVRPGATASKAGPDMLQRVAALEQGALGRPGPEIANGCTITSDMSQPGGVAWEKRRKTQQTYTGSTNTGPIAAGAASGAFLAAPTFAADGTSTYLIEWGCTGVGWVSAGPGVNRWDLILVDAGVEIAALPGYLCSSNVFPWNYGQVERVLSAGNHSITMHMRNQTGATSTASFSGSVNSPLWIRVNKVVPA